VFIEFKIPINNLISWLMMLHNKVNKNESLADNHLINNFFLVNGPLNKQKYTTDLNKK